MICISLGSITKMLQNLPAFAFPVFNQNNQVYVFILILTRRLHGQSGVISHSSRFCFENGTHRTSCFLSIILL